MGASNGLLGRCSGVCAEDKPLLEPANCCLILEGVTRGEVLGLEGVGSNATNPVGSDADELVGVPSKVTNPVDSEADGLGVAEDSAGNSARVLAAHALILGLGC